MKIWQTNCPGCKILDSPSSYKVPPVIVPLYVLRISYVSYSMLNYIWDGHFLKHSLHCCFYYFTAHLHQYSYFVHQEEHVDNTVVSHTERWPKQTEKWLLSISPYLLEHLKAHFRTWQFLVTPFPIFLSSWLTHFENRGLNSPALHTLHLLCIKPISSAHVHIHSGTGQNRDVS